MQEQFGGRPIVTAPPTDTKPPASAETTQRPKPTLAQRIVGFTFIGAFGLTMLTVVLTGLYVKSPSSRRASETPAVTLTVGDTRTIDLVFGSRVALEDVEFTVDLPPGIELAAHPGQRRVTGRAALAGGDNALPLTLVARSGGGQLAARQARRRAEGVRRRRHGRRAVADLAADRQGRRECRKCRSNFAAGPPVTGVLFGLSRRA
jgi:hypothetical protein